MQIQAENFALLANIINQAKYVYILTGKNPSEDTLAAGLFLEESLATAKKRALVVAPGELPENMRYLASKVSKKVPAKKLVVSFNWQANQIEKVSYNLDGEKFNFIISPRNKKINVDEVNIFHTGDDPDLIITLGVRNWTELTNFDKETLESKTIVNIDKNGQNSNFGSLNFVHASSDSISGIVALLAEKAKMPIKSKSEDLLMMGMKAETNNFENVSDPITFEAAAFCTRQKDKQKQEIKEPEKSSAAPKEWLSPKVYRTKQTPN